MNGFVQSKGVQRNEQWAQKMVPQLDAAIWWQILSLNKVINNYLYHQEIFFQSFLHNSQTVEQNI